MSNVELISLSPNILEEQFLLIRFLIVTAFGLGKLKPAPGTWGSLPPCVLAAGFLFFDLNPWYTDIALASIVVVSCVLCIQLGPWAEKRFDGKDPGVVVIDEVAGMAIALLFLPHALANTSGLPAHQASGYLIIIGAFLLFRIFDIIKTPPANVMQQFPAGWGILLDDIVAGLYANIVLQCVVRLGLPLLISSS